ncbi:PepSY domain-containing protein [Oceanobacillus iheyensis]|uniref:PepSY domain-containing protein n=1 Tax=Oceanobacillus iheyensis TaxID=182710 RepID=UPI00362B0CA0
MKKKLAVLVGALTISTAVGVGFSQSDQAASASENNKQPTLSSEDITSIVNEQYEGDITDFELDRDDNQIHYEVELINDDEEYDLEIDAETGEIIKENVEKFQLENKQGTKNSNVDSSNFIGDKKAKEIALEQFSGKVVEFELDEDDGKYVYEIEVRDGNKEADFEIDAVTGNVLEMDIETDDDDDDDDDRYDD